MLETTVSTSAEGFPLLTIKSSNQVAGAPVPGGYATLIIGSAAPADDAGNLGDYFLDEPNNMLYGPKQTPDPENSTPAWPLVGQFTA